MTARSFITLNIFGLSFVNSYRTSISNRILHTTLKLPASLNMDDERYICLPLEDLFGDQSILYYNHENPLEEDFPLAYYDKIIREVPLLLFEEVVFRGYKYSVDVAEMELRYVFQNIERGDNIFGRCYATNEKMALVGNLCKAVNRSLLDNGNRKYDIEVLGKFIIRNIAQQEPYLYMAEVELQPSDVYVPEEVAECEQLVGDVYYLLKLYIRLARLPRRRQESHEVKITPDIYNNWKQDVQESDGGAARHERFSFAVANLLDTEPVILQLLLQTRSTSFRLNGIKSILVHAVEELCELLSADELLGDEELEAQESLASSDYDDDLRAPCISDIENLEGMSEGAVGGTAGAASDWDVDFNSEAFQ